MRSPPTGDPTRDELTLAVSLLERAIGYARGTLATVTPDALGRPTPCREWDLRRLLAHMDDALDAFTEAGGGAVGLRPIPGEPVLDRIRARACHLLGTWAAIAGAPRDDTPVRVGGAPLSRSLLVLAGAVEITVHGWDVGRATGHRLDVPEDLARDLLPVAGILVVTGDRPQRFAAEVTASPGDAAAVRLLGFLGRVA